MTHANPNEGIELLYTRECSAWQETLANLRQALEESDIPEEPKVIPVDTLDQAYEYGFFASPTIHIDGVDIDPHARRTGKRGLGCGRPYFEGGKGHAAPSVAMLKRALQELYLGERT